MMEYVNGTLYKEENKTVDELPAEAGGSCQEVTGGQWTLLFYTCWHQILLPVDFLGQIGSSKNLDSSWFFTSIFDPPIFSELFNPGKDDQHSAFFKGSKWEHANQLFYSPINIW